MRILIADDSAEILDRMVALLSERTGVEVVGTARDVAETLAAVGRLHPECVVLDIRMPGGSGIEVLREIKARCPATVVIMLTNYADDQHRARSVAAGADAFFDKSIEFARVPEKVEEIARGRTISDGA